MDGIPHLPVSIGLARRIFKNTAFILAGNFLSKVLNFVFSIAIIRQLGDDRFGQYSVVISFVSLFQILAEFGMSQYVMREIARDKSQTPVLFWNLVWLRGLLALAAMVGIPLGAAAFQYSNEIVLGVLIYTGTFLFSAVQSPLQMVLTSNERLDYVTAMNVVGQFVFVVSGGVILFGGLGYLWLIAAGLLNLVVQIVLGMAAVGWAGVKLGPARLDPSTWGHLIRSGLPFGVIALCLTIAFNIDTVILSKYAPASAVGWYNVAYNLVFSLIFISNSFKEAMTPSLARTFASDPSEVEKWYFRTVRVILMVSLPLAVGGMILAAGIVRLLYTETYLPAVGALQIIIWDVPLLMFASFCGNISTVIKKELVGARIYALTAAVNIVLNLIFIPRFGFLGAAFITVLTDLIAAGQFYVFLKRALNLPDIKLVAVKTAAACVVMAGAVYLVRGLHVVIAALAGVLVYLGCLALFGMLDQTEIRLLQNTLSKIRTRFVTGFGRNS